MIAEIVSLSGYESQASALLNEDERMAMEFYIACAPEDHPVIPGAGGFRKARWARRGKGKRGGLRVVYFFVAEPGRIYRRRIIMGVRILKTGTKRRTKLGMELERSAREILAHVKGEARLPMRRIALPDEVEVKRVRKKARKSHRQFHHLNVLL